MVPLDQAVNASLVLQSKGLQVKCYLALSMKTRVISLRYLLIRNLNVLHRRDDLPDHDRFDADIHPFLLPPDLSHP